MVVVTSDNPRTEEPNGIVAQIAEGAAQGGAAHVHIEVDRRVAIDAAVAQADVADVVLIAGKGHEAYQDIMGVKHPYSDLEQVNQAIQKWLLEKKRA